MSAVNKISCQIGPSRYTKLSKARTAFVPCHVKSKICTIEELSRCYPGLEKVFWKLEKDLQTLDNVSLSMYGTCDIDAPTFPVIERIMDCIAATAYKYRLDCDFYCAYFHDAENRHAHGIPRRTLVAELDAEIGSKPC